jgi:hypothetical protein
MKITCPECHTEIPLDDVNVSTDIALCRKCGETFSFSELNEDGAMVDVNLSPPPSGTWSHSQGNGFEVGATTRSALAFLLVPFTMIWSGISLGGIYGSQIAHGKFVLTQSLFGLPFPVGSLVLIPITLMSIFGKVVVRGSGDEGSVFMGLGPAGWTRRFRWSEIKKVHLSETRWQQNGRNLPLLEFAGDNKSLRFGSQLSENRRNFMLAALRQHVSRR